MAFLNKVYFANGEYTLVSDTYTVINRRKFVLSNLARFLESFEDFISVHLKGNLQSMVYACIFSFVFCKTG